MCTTRNEHRHTDFWTLEEDSNELLHDPTQASVRIHHGCPGVDSKIEGSHPRILSLFLPVADGNTDAP